MAKEHDGYGHLAEAIICGGFDGLEVEVAVVFFGTQGFSARRDAR